MRPSVASPTGTVIGRARVDRLGAARQAVGRVHRDRPHAVVAEVLLDLAHEHVPTGLGGDALGLLGRGRRRTGDRDRVVDLGQLVGEDDVEHDALDLLDAPNVARAGVCGGAHFGCRLGCDAGVHFSFVSPSGLSSLVEMPAARRRIRVRRSVASRDRGGDSCAVVAKI